jgi:ribosomal protein S6--L-glutamate ligase
MAMTGSPFIVGWQEWLALPELGLPAIKAKIDTGARTSALHAFLIEPFGPSSAPMVRFGVHPIPGRLDVAIFASAPVVDRREVTSSNGERDTRYFIRTQAKIGDRVCEIEVGLTNRESMSYRMLLGRQAIRDDMMVDAATSFRQTKLSYKLYREVPRIVASSRALRIALVVRDVGGAFNAHLAATAIERGHTLEMLEVGRLRVSFGRESAVLVRDGVPLAHYDAVIPRIGLREGIGGAAIIRQMEAAGCLSLNSGDAIDRVSNRIAVGQALVRGCVAQAMFFSDGPIIADSAVDGAGFMRMLVIGGAAATMIGDEGRGERALSLARYRAERRIAEHAAEALHLGLATVDVVEIDGEVAVARVSARPALGRFARLSRKDLAGGIIDAVEAEVGARGRRASIAEA